MITKTEIQILKEQYQKEADYYDVIGFPILQGKFQEIINLLTKIENDIPDTEITEEEKE